MELYILDNLLRRTAVIDRFESLIWTERFSAVGDFQLKIHSTLESRSLLVEGTNLAVNESYRVMTIETVNDSVDAEGRALLEIKGPSFENLNALRVARKTMIDNSTNESKWILTGKPADIARQVFDYICVQGKLDPSDIIPFITTGNLFPPDTILEPSTVVTIEITPDTVYKVVKDICDIYDLGFRLYRGLDTSKLYFNIYTGSDRTTTQTALPPVVFSPALDNLQDVSELRSIAQYKNVAYVVSPAGTAIVYADGVDATTAGLDRRVMLVNATDITLPDRPYTVAANYVTSINAVIALATTTDVQKASLNKLINKKRLGLDDLATIATLTVAGAPPTATQKSDIQSATDQSKAYNATEDAAVAPLLQQKGKDELAKNRSLAALDGEVPQFGSYKYGVDYQLGDLVEMRNVDGVTNIMRVTEQIIVSDNQGERSYPTLVTNQFITPGSWPAFEYNTYWDNAVGTWDDQP